MSYLHTIKRTSNEKNRKEAIEIVILELIKRGVDIKKIAKATCTPIAKIQKIQEKDIH